jgi:hypothetical protein
MTANLGQRLLQNPLRVACIQIASGTVTAEAKLDSFIY